ncbi:aminotransferase class I/II-fold pyridoxal phosphate-dependent enzyme [Haloimpatiens lingqiaonensis]|uniref:aminotransferase class I/II-fold pyridoxal phosphate-dependent enzyme n=1 Tax=Haloimpatiens lingqiaonensis TaxID=1380675 RepID=UPI0010FF56D4|nr:aminotransferase class I/II-fold pyridoxal phosphate-dependent enzyme [Haloimpatiens lingqiaonensis]
MSGLPLLEGLLEYMKEKNISFCMPGHKGGKGFLATEVGKEFLDNLSTLDITEVDGVDNLHNAEGIIRESQELLSAYYGSKKSYFLVNGSTSGNLAMIFSSFEEGDKIIVERNCHRSIFNGIIMRKLKPVYVKNKINEKFNAPLSIDMEHFLCTLENNKDAKGIILTYPNYYGVCLDLKRVVEEAEKYNMKVLVDSAHGAHFGINCNLPQHAINLGAHMAVMSSHKTLPSFTQTAYLHIGNHEVEEDKVDFYVSAFLSTSPSYMLMGSMDYARYYLQEKGKKGYEKLIDLCKTYREKINKLNGFYILGNEDINPGEKIDLTRYILNVEKGYSGHKLLSYLRQEGIQCEMSDGQNVMLIFSPFNDVDEFEKLYTSLKKCDLSKLQDKYKKSLLCEIPKMAMEPYKVMNKIKVKISLEEAAGKISASAIVPYPPGIPLIMPGEIITRKAIDMIKYNLENHIDVMGLDEKNEEIEVLDF